jgi:hypothetical protein
MGWDAKIHSLEGFRRFQPRRASSQALTPAGAGDSQKIIVRPLMHE